MRRQEVLGAQHRAQAGLVFHGKFGGHVVARRLARRTVARSDGSAKAHQVTATIDHYRTQDRAQQDQPWAASAATGSLALESSGFATATVATLATVTTFALSDVATVAGVA